MKVTGQQPPKPNELGQSKAREAEQRQPKPPSQQGRDSEPFANRTSLTLNKVKDAIRSEPDVRAEKVAELQAKLRDGKYQVDRSRLAENLLRGSLREDLERP